MNNTGRRIRAYGMAAAVAGCLCYGGFFYRADADVLTRLSAVDVQLRLVGVFTPNQGNQAATDARKKILADVRHHLDEVDRVQPDCLPAVEFRAYLELLEHEYLRSAELYGRALRLEGVTPEIRDTLAMNQALGLRRGGRLKESLDCLHEDAFLPKNRAKALLERARVQYSLGRPQEALETAQRVVSLDPVEPMSLVVTGQLLEEWGDPVGAERTYLRAATQAEMASYYIGRLKVCGGDFDMGLAMLERAVRGAGSQKIRALLRRDAELWEPVSREERFITVVSSRASAAPPKR